MSYLVIVSNRGPFSFSQDFLSEAEMCLKKGTRPRDISFGQGGLVRAMVSLLRSSKWTATWIGASMGDRDIDVARGYYTHLFNRMKKAKLAPRYFPLIEFMPDLRMRFRYRDYDFFMRFVFFDTKHMHSYYNKFANGFLWPLMHLTRSPLFYKKARVFPRPRFEKNAFVQYMSSGVTFANTIIDEMDKIAGLKGEEEDIIVWHQDYHLMQIAEVLNDLLQEEGVPGEKRKKIRIGQFIHTPFFNIHEIQGLVREDKRSRIKDQIHDPFAENIETALQRLTWGLLANDFIGFQTEEYCDNFLEALEEWFPVDIRMTGHFYEITYQDNITTIGACPIGLDVDNILSEVSEGKKLSYKFRRESLYERIRNDRERGRYIFGGLERCDYTKGLLERLGIFWHAFNRLSAFKKKARFYQVTAPSRLDHPDYKELDSELEKEVSKINEQLKGSPIVHINEGISPPQNYRFMKELDLMLVTPLEDGMNLVAFEYILSQKDKRPENRGVLVLSTCGASRVLKQKGFGVEDGVVFVNPMKQKDAGERVAQALLRGSRISERLINYVQEERRVDDWAEENIDAILNCRKSGWPNKRIMGCGNIRPGRRGPPYHL